MIEFAFAPPVGDDDASGLLLHGRYGIEMFYHTLEPRRCYPHWFPDAPRAWLHCEARIGVPLEVWRPLPMLTVPPPTTENNKALSAWMRMVSGVMWDLFFGSKRVASKHYRNYYATEDGRKATSTLHRSIYNTLPLDYVDVLLRPYYEDACINNDWDGLATHYERFVSLT
ncbi:MAG: hypothetical protein AAFR56_15025, partial [Chloroflexota bacterium]